MIEAIQAKVCGYYLRGACSYKSSNKSYEVGNMPTLAQEEPIILSDQGDENKELTGLSRSQTQLYCKAAYLDGVLPLMAELQRDNCSCYGFPPSLKEFKLR